MTPDDHYESVGLSTRLPNKQTLVETLTMICLLTLMVLGVAVLITLDVFLRL